MSNEQRYKEALELIAKLRTTSYSQDVWYAMSASIAKNVLEGARAVLNESGTVVLCDVPEEMQKRWREERRVEERIQK